MTNLWVAILLSLGAGGAAFLGALLGRFEDLKPNWMTCESRHGIVAFGGGALLAAIALVLIPEGTQLQPAWLSIITFLAGAAFFMGVDWYLSTKGSSVSQFMALLLDFVPEAVVLGAIISMDFPKAIFLAVIISAQNFPEGFNAYREMTHGKDGNKGKHVMLMMAMAALTGPLWASGGYFLFEHDSIGLGALMTFCAGGILYLVFRDIAPQAKLEKHWLPSFGAILGFALGMIGHAFV